MKNILFTLLIIVSFTSCKNDSKTEVNLDDNRAKSYDANDGYITVRGEFVYYADAAVLQTSNEIYGVVIDDNMHLLDNEVQPYKKDPTDMVPVTVRVKKFAKPEGEEGWEYRVKIKEILKVEKPNPNKEDVIKLSN
ncbi:hypothetical protein BWZ20_08500 [Winogradskyella sp. J14-2]|uniref:hypothetical protein n=1 Tax=Winogradskyella sp. J14-2 TaxID=1936080 RepID=UPI0009729BD2|nr:hypothetical protein [Winogradskyella sp. J14-2]APY08335.1 hypothetical protein BWZ20_08500 [Winogradskyella sp. J14-2]